MAMQVDQPNLSGEFRRIEHIYSCSLLNLRTTSRVAIENLTNLAWQNRAYAEAVVRAIEDHLAKVHQDVQLPVLYLIDSIIKNVKRPYDMLFARNIVRSFHRAFVAARNEERRKDLKNLRATWTHAVFPGKVQVNLDRVITEVELLHKREKFLALQSIEVENKLNATKRQVIELQKKIEGFGGAERKRHSTGAPPNVDAKKPRLAEKENIQPRWSHPDSSSSTSSISGDENNNEKSTAINPSNLYESLLKAGLILPTRTAQKSVGDGLTSVQATTSSSPAATEIEKDIFAAKVQSIVKVAKNEETLREERIELVKSSFDSLSLKTKQPAVVAALYTGKQCSSCGERFQGENARKAYDQHLDWHFRQNRCQKAAVKRGSASRGWFMRADAWTNDGGDDDDDEEECFFEKVRRAKLEQKMNAAEKQPSVKDDGSRRCRVCNESFEQFYNVEDDEWQLRPAVLYDAVSVHPICLDDFKKNKF